MLGVAFNIHIHELNFLFIHTEYILKFIISLHFRTFNRIASIN